MWIMGTFSSGDVRQLLHNKFVVVLGDSIQRTVYKDLVKLLQDDRYLTESQLKKKGEKTFANDTLVEGGELNEMHNGTSFREVRQYRTGYHLVRFYFLTRVYSTYLESVLSDFQSGLQPDVLIVNSCIWDISRYQDFQLEAYKTNVDNLFHRLTQVLSPECLILWNMTMPVGYKEGQMQELPKTNLRWDIVAGNFYSATLANFHKMDVLDMHYHFRLELHSRCRDATHWNQLAHRKYTQILLTHIAQAWGVEVPETKTAEVAEYIPGYTTFNGGNMAPAPPTGPFLPGYFNFDDHCIRSNATSSFVDDNPVLVGNLPPGYFNFNESCTTATGPMFLNNPFADMGIIPQPNIGFPYHGPWPPDAWQSHQRFTMRRAMSTRGTWTRSYGHYSPYPHRIY
ncbi:PC-esterase domain-containing protein 1A-like isoform X1 [Mixophyes fleayi]|uniref:PC-esterase domain-containing protein 1A-like isoform X1 n=1 Tax=Mixophyes fleayi TaxID=3061075 RepID=UPI003F4DBB36